MIVVSLKIFKYQDSQSHPSVNPDVHLDCKIKAVSLKIQPVFWFY